jgi:DNA polymerase-3 subunit delta'
VLIYPIERLNLISANTLLKTLEEPPGQVRFVLGGSALDELLPTVRSRCQALRLPTPDEGVAAEWLLSCSPGLSAQDAKVLLAASGGQPLTARDRHQNGLDARIWSQLAQDLLRGNSAAVAGWPLPMVVETLSKLCHDLSCVAVGAAPRFFPAQGLPKPPDLNRLTAWAQSLRKVSRHAEHPWNAGLKIESLLLQAQSVMAKSKAQVR